jgi:hypothetical protein
MLEIIDGKRFYDYTLLDDFFKTRQLITIPILTGEQNGFWTWWGISRPFTKNTRR